MEFLLEEANGETECWLWLQQEGGSRARAVARVTARVEAQKPRQMEPWQEEKDGASPG